MRLRSCSICIQLSSLAVFARRSLRPTVGGVVDVLDAAVTIEIELPGVLGMIASGLKGRLQKVGQLLLTKK